MVPPNGLPVGISLRLAHWPSGGRGARHRFSGVRVWRDGVHSPRPRSDYLQLLILVSDSCVASVRSGVFVISFISSARRGLKVSNPLTATEISAPDVNHLA